MFTIKKVADLAGVSLKALRHYDKLGLLRPSARGENNYRLYNENDLTKLQQIMFYKELDFPLDEIKNITNRGDFDLCESIEKQIELLKAKNDRLIKIIELAEKTLKNFKGELSMTEKEKFEAFKDKILDENEKKYGEEVIAKFGAVSYNASKKKVKVMTEQEQKELEKLSLEVNNAFIVAFKTKDANSKEARHAVELHKKWITFYWDSFDKGSYIALAKGYFDDERFANYYNQLSAGMAIFVRDCIVSYFE